VLTTKRAVKRCAACLRSVATVKSFGERVLDFTSASRWLRDEFGVKHLLLEGMVQAREEQRHQNDIVSLGF
jgi:hypothetical protein